MHTHTATTPPPGLPVEQDVSCPLCEYNLRGLTETRCPECGYRFTWDELNDPARQSHPYLFEHHPKHNTRSFFKTLGGAQRPTRFWKTLSPVQPSRPRRLFFYWFLFNGVLGLVLIAGLAATAIANAATRAQLNKRLQVQEFAAYNNPNLPPRVAQWRQRTITMYGSLQNYLDSVYPTSTWQILRNPRLLRMTILSAIPQAGLIVVIILLWPWFTFLALMVFQVSMYRARVRPVHVVRCVIYNADAFFWAVLICLPLTVLTDYGSARRGSMGLGIQTISGALLSEPAFFAAWIIWGIWTYRLTCAYRHYLRFDRPLATVLASQAVVFLIALNLLCLPMWLA